MHNKMSDKQCSIVQKRKYDFTKTSELAQMQSSAYRVTGQGCQLDPL